MTALRHTLLDPWQQPLLRRAFVEVVLLGVAGGTVGSWVILHKLSYSAESLAHSLLPGLVVAALVGAPLLLGGAVGILVAALAVATAGRIPWIEGDTAVAVVITTLFGLGVLLALSPASPPGIDALLFGDVLGVTDGDLALSAGLVVVVLASLGLLHDRLLVVGFDRTSAAPLGVSSARADLTLLALLASVLVIAVQGLGNLLVVAVLIAPAASARVVSRRMRPMLMSAAAFAVLGGIGGLYLSYYAGLAAGASVAAVLVATYGLTGAGRALARRVSR